MTPGPKPHHPRGLTPRMRLTSAEIHPAGIDVPQLKHSTRGRATSHIHPIAFNKQHTEGLPNMSRSTSDHAAPSPAPSGKSLVAIALLYNAARLALAAALCGLILLISFVFDVKIPIFGAVVLAVVLSSPVSMLVLKPLRTRINHQAEAMDAHHASKRGLAKSRSVNLPDS